MFIYIKKFSLKIVSIICQFSKACLKKTSRSSRNVTYLYNLSQQSFKNKVLSNTHSCFSTNVLALQLWENFKHEATYLLQVLIGESLKLFTQCSRASVYMYMRLLWYSDNRPSSFFVMFAQLWLSGAKIA